MYPAARRDEVNIDIAGRLVPDPYRWLEGDGADVALFIDQQNAHSRPYLEALPERKGFVEILTRLLDAPVRGCPWRRGDWLFAWVNDGADQPRLIRSATVAGLEKAETVLDPNLLSTDGKAAVVSAVVNDDATLLVYAVAEGGSDWRTIRVLDLETLTDLGHEIRWTKWNDPVWLPGGRSFTFLSYDEPSGNALTEVSHTGTLTAFNVDSGERSTLWLPPTEQTHGTQLRDNEWFVLATSERMEPETQIWVRRHEEEQLRLLVDGAHEWWPVVVRDGELIAVSYEDAPRGRAAAVNLDTGETRELLAQHPSRVLVGLEPTAAGYVAHYMEDAQCLLVPLDRRGNPGAELPVGEACSISGLNSLPDSEEVFLATSRFSDRGERFVARLRGAELVSWERIEPAPGAVNVPCRVERFEVNSSDGAAVRSFILRPTSAQAGPQPTLIWGYGGFNIPMVPEYRTVLSAWLAAGGTLVVANLRGGGEFGDAWHAAGTRERKQQVFDDLYAVAEGLIARGVTTAHQLGLHGRSNGGLLVGAALTQRPDLWAAAVPGVGVLDMLRFHKFTVGWAWTWDYGDPDDPAAAEYLLAYSPVHNVRPQRYPPTLITTGDHDDRVVPAHSYKFAAQLQHLGEGGPFLLAVDTRVGHGQGKPKSASLAELADQLAFLAHHTGLTPATALPSPQ
ncbi:prolyl oligopeptidase family protein [Tessaracoccus sp. OH4464_COT-324]|uniref:prolyl oligopeptidase family serine peptidase n=1 Tax=Tessaracoccus sp. OH4464_COT-324 TaxID=2491059 RepID=UPI001319F0D1|nr:prolyl oligopeptidase family serine peptidase [Tessaracoccus sp. OH4464_COT-324]